MVPRVSQILKHKWDAAAFMTVIEFEVGCGNFQLVELASIMGEDKGENVEILKRLGKRAALSWLSQS